MVEATVDNTPVDVLLETNENYTPANGSIQKVNVLVDAGAELFINNVRLVNREDANVTQASYELLITDRQTLKNPEANGVYISGFEVN